MLAELFEKNDKLDNLQKFVSGTAQNVYGLTPRSKEIILEKKSMQVPEKYGEVVPFMAGETIAWSISNS